MGEVLEFPVYKKHDDPCADHYFGRSKLDQINEIEEWSRQQLRQMVDDLLDVAEEAEDPPVDCPHCGGKSVIEEREPAIYGPIVRVLPCPKCKGTGRA